jgi:hypothetical protein
VERWTSGYRVMGGWNRDRWVGGGMNKWLEMYGWMSQRWLVSGGVDEWLERDGWMDQRWVSKWKNW